VRLSVRALAKLGVLFANDDVVNSVDREIQSVENLRHSGATLERVAAERISAERAHLVRPLTPNWASTERSVTCAKLTVRRDHPTVKFVTGFFRFFPTETVSESLSRGTPDGCESGQREFVRSRSPLGRNQIFAIKLLPPPASPPERPLATPPTPSRTREQPLVMP
jgi:hypothetical protein